jgi:type II secretory pathway pseudopilin PulG
MFTGFLVGFITVLCIGNYFRAKRAQERQRQRRLAKQGAQQQQSSSQDNNLSTIMSKNAASLGSARSGNAGDGAYGDGGVEAGGGGYEAPPLSVGNGVRA